MENEAFITQVPQDSSQSPAKSIIQDEDLEKIKSEYLKTYNEWKESLEKMNDEKFESNNILFTKKSFFNNDRKIQDFRRGRLFSSLLNAKSYTHTMDNYQELLTEKIRNNSNSHILPEGKQFLIYKIRLTDEILI